MGSIIRDWEKILTERDRQVFGTAGYGQTTGFGRRPALLVIDVNYAFVGERLPILESIASWPQSTGEEAWEVVDRLVGLLAKARSMNVPVIYTTNQSGSAAEAARSRRKLPLKRRHLEPDKVERGRQIVAEVSPKEGDIVIEKPHASAFVGTPLLSILSGLAVDTLLLTGGTLSGCVRAAAIDAAANNYFVSVIEDGTFDRAQASRLASLFDLNAKYADVVALSEVNDYLDSLVDHSQKEPGIASKAQSSEPVEQP